MNIKIGITVLFITGIMFLSGCQQNNYPEIGESEKNTPVPLAKSSPTSISNPTSTTTGENIVPPVTPSRTPEPTLIIFSDELEEIPIFWISNLKFRNQTPTIQAPQSRNNDSQLPSNWVIEEYPNTFRREIILRYFDELGGLYGGWHSYEFDFNGKILTVDLPCIEYKVRYNDESKSICRRRDITVSIDGEEVFRALKSENQAIEPTWPIYKIWVIEDQWLMEIRYVVEEDGNWYCRESVIINGESVNDIYGYDRSFSLQLISGKPFFFTETSGNFGYSYNLKHYNLDYKDIWYYCCCGAAQGNPVQFINGVLFEAQIYGSDDDWHYIVMGPLDPHE